ncbi:hypothetical protein J7E73_23270 [Paenibacillus albidus]|uniref:hypothetical protein n=1 Tax=Paenibacillus albidus TaxID=2041023 RepID=UPI001BE98753|nr:hypothetical protein [Paenibacillus albidus]MBT2291997.1 hypothetical protein [Paenibacillus albidus]
MDEIKAVLESGTYKGIPIGEAYEALRDRASVYANPPHSEDGTHVYPDLQIEEIDNLIYAIHLPAPGRITLEDLIGNLGEGTHNANEYHMSVTYWSSRVIANCKFPPAGKYLTEVSLVTTAFMD